MMYEVFSLFDAWVSITACVAKKLNDLFVELRGIKLIYETELPLKYFSVALISNLKWLVNTP